MKNTVAVLFFAFLLTATMGFGQEIAKHTLPIVLILLGAIGITLFILFMLMTLLAIRATRQDKPWGLKYLKFMAGGSKKS